MKLKLSLNKFKGTGITHVEDKTETRFIRQGEKCPIDASLKRGERNKEWNYDKQGADWAEKYPDCGLPQQSPINLLDPVTEYGRAYEIHAAAADEHAPTYSDLGATPIDFDTQKYTIEVSFGEGGSSGFAS